MYAVESCPALRDITGTSRAIRLADMLVALRQLDGNDHPPSLPRGIGIRLRRRSPSGTDRASSRC